MKNTTIEDVGYAVFGYKRPKHLERCLDALVENLDKESPVYLFLDGPRTDEDKTLVEETRSVAHKYSSKLSITFFESESNKGLASSLISGVTKVLSIHPCIVVIEDDIVISSAFLSFVRSGLTIYKNKPEVASIHGYCPPFEQPMNEPFFLRGADCWGWATWSDRWESINLNAESLIQEIQSKKMERTFDFDFTFPFMKLLKNTAMGITDSWAILWHASIFVQNRMTLYPPYSLVENIGFDSSGSNFTTSKNSYETKVNILGEIRLPSKVLANEEGYNKMVRFYLLSGGTKNKIIRIFKKIFQLYK